MTLIKSISGIRGTIGGLAGDTLNPLDIVKFTSAYATFIRRSAKSDSNKIVVGRDARISGEMVKENVGHIMDVKPDFLIGADASCLLNIGGRLNREGHPVKVMHIAEVLMHR